MTYYHPVEQKQVDELHQVPAASDDLAHSTAGRHIPCVRPTHEPRAGGLRRGAQGEAQEG